MKHEPTSNRSLLSSVVVLSAAVVALIIIMVGAYFRLQSGGVALSHAQTGLQQAQAHLQSTQGDLKTAQKGLEQAQASIHQSAQQSCVIQSRGLKAQRHLTNLLDGIHSLLTLPPTIASQRQQSMTPRRRLRLELVLLRKVDDNLAAYVSIERHQPHHRKCS